MKAIVYREYGSPDVLRLEEIEKPVPGPDEVVVKVIAASVNPADVHMLHGVPLVMRILLGMKQTTIQRAGSDLAGVVEAVGTQVRQFKTGDEVFGSCKGAFAEYACGSESKLAHKPDAISFEQAASVPVAALTALQGLRDKGHIRAGQQLLINGAAGGVGTFAVQIAKSFGAEVTGVCSATNLEMVRSIGADRVIDYTVEDFTARTERYDLIFDLVANHSIAACRRVMKPGGIYIGGGILGIDAPAWILVRMATMPLFSRFGSRKFLMFMARINSPDLAAVGDLMEGGKLTAVIDRRYPLREVPDAMRHVADHHARGKVIISVP